MRVTRVEVRFAHKSGPASSELVGYATVRLDDELAISHIRIVRQSGGGLRIKMPSVDAWRGPRDVAYVICARMDNNLWVAIQRAIAASVAAPELMRSGRSIVYEPR